MNKGRLLSYLMMVAVAFTGAACTLKDQTAPPLSGPSELGLSLAMTASPDVLSQDGASQSQIQITAFDENGQPKPNTVLRVEIGACGSLFDFGTISARNVVTNSSGKAVITYTAPISPAGGAANPCSSVAILATPVGTDAANSLPRTVTIRLVPPGVIIAGGPSAHFTFTPATPNAFADVIFDGSTSTAAIGTGIVSYSWNFGDGSSALGQAVTHQFAAGSFTVTLTVTDTNGFASSTSQSIVVGAGNAPTADFNFSPQSPGTDQAITFSGGLSKAGTGHTLVRYDWDFGTGSTQTGQTVTKSFDVAGTYSVTLTVTDEKGQTAQVTKPVTISGSGGLTASFNFSPTNPKVVDSVNFDARSSTTVPGTTITNYSWDFGDGTGTFDRTTPTIAHTFPSARVWVVRLTLTDSAGRTATTTQSLTIAP